MTKEKTIVEFLANIPKHIILKNTIRNEKEKKQADKMIDKKLFKEYKNGIITAKELIEN